MLENIIIGKTDYIRLKRDIANWASAGAIAYATKDMDVILNMLYVECKEYDRPYNRQRLYSRFSKLRRDKELKSLPAFLKDVKITAKAKTKNAVLNQRTLSAYMDAKTLSADYVLKLLKAEYNDSRRPYIVKKLYALFSTIRRDEEKKEYETAK